MSAENTRTSRLSGKVAIVSGAGTYGGSGVGNGAAAAIVFARAGAKVVLVDAVQQWADATKDIIEEEGGEAMSADANVTDADECRRVVEAAVDRFGRLDVLHNNVGGGGASGSVVDATDEDWANSMSVNLMSMINMSRCAVPHMKSGGGGSIINVSSVTALRPKTMRSSAPYTVNKSAVVGLTRAMAVDHAADNIRVNCIMPGRCGRRAWPAAPPSLARCVVRPPHCPSKARAGTSAGPRSTWPATKPASSPESPSPWMGDFC